MKWLIFVAWQQDLTAYPLNLHRTLMFPARLLCKIPGCFRQALSRGKLGPHESGQIWHSCTLSRTAG